MNRWSGRLVDQWNDGVAERRSNGIAIASPQCESRSKHGHPVLTRKRSNGEPVATASAWICVHLRLVLS
jgi:hypothetical protein